MIKAAITLLSLSLFLVACEDPSANKVKAKTSDPSNTSNTSINVTKNNNTSNTSVSSVSLPINPDNSKIEFTGSKVTDKHDGGFKKFSGAIDLVGDKPENSSVSVDIETASIYVNIEQLTEHLKTPDFFDVQKYPKATFVSTKIVPDLAGGDAYQVTGDFELHGVKKSITFPAAIDVNADDVTVNSEFSINRKDFGIMYAGKADDLIRDGVAIRLNLKAPRTK
jgi:polyisoprenoid-binding protein YceI